MRACPACGASNSPTEDFCATCGTYLGWSSARPPAPEPPGPQPPAQEPAATPEVSPAPEQDAPAAPEPAAPEPEPPARPFGVRSRRRTPEPGPAPAPAAPAPGPAPGPDLDPDPAPVVPVRPAKAAAPRPVVRPVAEPEAHSGEPCPVCGTLNPPDRRFCRRCAAPLNPAPARAALPWWRTMWPLRRRVRAGSGRLSRFVVILLAIAVLAVLGVLLIPAGRGLFEDTKDKLDGATQVKPVRTTATAAVPGHPAAASVDGLNNRYWGAPAAGASVTYTFARPIRLVDLIITNGASTTPQDYDRQARALTIDLDVTTKSGATHHQELTLEDRPGDQTFTTGVSDATTVRLTLRAPAGLSAGRHLALAEVEFFRRG